MKPLIPVLFAAIFPAMVGAADLPGTWISCNPGAPWRYALLSVERDGSAYRWVAEWGSPYSAGGTAVRQGSALVLHGCSSYRGEVSDGCDRDKPPVFLTLKRKDLERYRKFLTQADLRRARWVRVTGEGDAWEKLAKNCEDLILKKQGAQTPGAGS